MSSSAIALSEKIDFPWPIAVMSFNRPKLLEQILLSIQAQTWKVSEANIFLFQDGYSINERNQTPDGDQNNECVKVFKEIFPKSTVFNSSENLGVAFNFDRAERFFFSENEFEAAVFFEDDLLLSPYYLETLFELVNFALREEQVAYVAAYGNHHASLEQQRTRCRDIILMEHKWGFALTRRQWSKQRPLIEPYLQLLKGKSYKSRDHGAIRTYFQQLGFVMEGTSQDAAKDVASAVLGTAKIMSYACFGKYIGKIGLHQTEEDYQQKGYDNTVLFPQQIKTFNFPNGESLANLQARNYMTASHVKTQIKIGDPITRLKLDSNETDLVYRAMSGNQKRIMFYGMNELVVVAAQIPQVCCIVVEPEPMRVVQSLANPIIRSAVDAKNLKIIYAFIGEVDEYGNPNSQADIKLWTRYFSAGWQDWNEINARPDLVIVGSRFRVACCLLTAIFAPYAEVILLNSSDDRPHYSEIEKFYFRTERVRTVSRFRLREKVNLLDVFQTFLQYQLDFR